MIVTIWRTLLGAWVLAAGSLPASAHHSALMYDTDTTITLMGVVKEFQYTNPHSWLLVDVQGEDGTVTTWGFEGLSVSNMARAGIRPSDFVPGTRLTISGHPLRDGRPAAEWLVATREEDGKEFHAEVGFEIP